MATWHQQRAGLRLWHPTEWAVVTDPPGECTSVMTWSTREKAEAFVGRLRSLGKAEHTYILNPGGER